MMPEPSSRGSLSPVSIVLTAEILGCSAPSDSKVKYPPSTASVMTPSTAIAASCSSALPYPITSMGMEEASADEDGK